MNRSRAYRILIADDSPTARELLKALLEQEGLQVVGEATQGAEAVQMARDLRPDLITMDLQMPVMDGMQAIEAIMHEKAVPILVVSSQADAEIACQALNLGALDVISKPNYTPEEAKQFARKARTLAGVSVITRMRRRESPTPAASSTPLWKSSSRPSNPAYQQAFAIASSTGGPQALARLLPCLEADFPAPILLAQHMCDGFVEGMAHWLDRLCKLRVKVAEEGELIQPGCVYVSPSESHLIVTPQHRLALQSRVDGEVYRPSCDHLLASVAQVYGRDAVGIILTGMGRDGAAGIYRIREQGGIGLAQDEPSSVIYGMNHEAIKLGGVHRELPLDAMAGEMQLILKLGPAAYLADWSRSQA